MQVGKSAQEAKVGDLKSNDQQNQIFREAHRIKIENQDIVGDKWIYDDDCNMAFYDKSKLAPCNALLKVKEKYAVSSGLNLEMILASDNDIILAIIHLKNNVVAESKITNNWSLSYIINCYKYKGDVLLRGNYSGLRLLDQAMKVINIYLQIS